MPLENTNLERIGTCPRCGGAELTTFLHERKEEGYAVPALHCINCGHYSFLGKPTPGTLAMPIGRVITAEERIVLARK